MPSRSDHYLMRLTHASCHSDQPYRSADWLLKFEEPKPPEAGADTERKQRIAATLEMCYAAGLDPRRAGLSEADMELMGWKHY